MATLPDYVAPPAPPPAPPTQGTSGKKRRRKGKPLSEEGKETRREFREAKRIANAMGLLDPLQRLGTSLETSLALPYEIGPDGKPVIDPLTGRYKVNEAYVGNRSQQQQDQVANLQKQVEMAGERSEQMRSLMARMEGGLAGLNAQENTALREQAQREMDRQYQTALNQLNIAQARSGVRGASATAQMGNLSRQAFEERSNLEQDLLTKNIDIQDQRRREYAGLLGSQEQAEFERKRGALGDLGSTLNELEQSEFDRARQAREELVKKELINLGQSNTEAARLASTLFGLTGYNVTKKSAAQQYELAKEGLANQKAAIEAQNAAINSSAGVPTTTPGTTPSDPSGQGTVATPAAQATTIPTQEPPMVPAKSYRRGQLRRRRG